MSTSIQDLVSRIPRISLGRFPSPVSGIGQLSSRLGVKIYEKNDGVNSVHYAGNKVRKLEYLLATQKAQNSRRIITLGSAGSNHAVATSTYAHQLGKVCSVCLVDQPADKKVQDNLLRHLALDTDLRWFENFKTANEYAQAEALSHDVCLIPLGGSSPLASMGFVRAAFELEAQVNSGCMPAPQRLYVACGTMGTAVGLLIGLALTNLSTTLYAIRVTDSAVASVEKFAQLTDRTLELMRERGIQSDLNFEQLKSRLRFCDEYFGDGYGIPTDGARAALQAGQHDNLLYDGTYTGKAMSALIDHGERGELADKTILFWNSLNRQTTPIAPVSEHHNLDEHFVKYFAG